MSVLVKGMTTPKNCKECKFSWWDVGNFYCEADGKPWGLEVTGCTEKRHSNCPLIEVPEPHGRLIDADELLERFNIEQKQKDMHGRGFASCFENCGELCTEWWCVEEMVENAPTVIPADKDGET